MIFDIIIIAAGGCRRAWGWS